MRKNHMAAPIALPLHHEHLHHDSKSELCRSAPVCIADQLNHAPGAWSRTLGRDLHSHQASALPPGCPPAFRPGISIATRPSSCLRLTKAALYRSWEDTLQARTVGS